MMECREEGSALPKKLLSRLRFAADNTTSVNSYMQNPETSNFYFNFLLCCSVCHIENKNSLENLIDCIQLAHKSNIKS